MKRLLSKVFSGRRDPEPSKPWLLVTTLSGEQRRLSIEAEGVSLGRSPENTLSFPDDGSLSRRHLAIREEAGQCYVEDLGSKNGTFVNGRATKSRRHLVDGDVIIAGDVTLTFQPPVGNQPSVSIVSDSELSMPVAERTMLADIVEARPGEEGAETDRAGSADRRALWAVIRAGRELTTRRSLPELFEATLDLSLDAVEAARGALLILDEAGRLVVQASRGGPIQVSTRLKDPVLKEKASLLLDDPKSLSTHETLVRQGVRSLMVVPLQTEVGVIGLIYLDSVDGERPFTKADLDLLTVMGNVASILIERERWDAQRQLLVSENVERLRRLAAAVSHEFNTPLGALKSAIDSLFKAAARGTPATPEKQARMAAIQADLRTSLDAALQRMEQVIGRIQRFTNLDGGDERLVDLNQVLADVVALAHEPSVEVGLTSEDLSPLRCDPQALSTTILSLLAFAVEMSRRDEAEGLVKISTRVRADGSELRIQVHGPSFSPEARKRIFDPSFQVADGRVVAGNWSLFTAHQVIHSMGGTIDASNEASGDLVLTVRFPA